jgi:hypothetical protein
VFGGRQALKAIQSDDGHIDNHDGRIDSRHGRIEKLD